MASLTLRIPDALKKELESASQEQGLSKSELVRQAIEGHLRVEPWRKLRQQFRPHLETQRIFTENEILVKLGED